MSQFSTFGGSGSITIYDNGVKDSYRPAINFIPGTNITISVVDNPTNNRADITINGSPSGVTSVTATSPLFSSGGATPNITIQVANTSEDGYLTATDWNTFNSKQPAGAYLTSVSVASSNGLAGTSSGGTTPTLTLSTTITGILQGNGTAISAATTGNLTDVGTDGITVTGGTGAVLGSGTSLSQHVADTTHNGYLSSTDWNTFNGKLTSSLASGDIFVGNASNVATAVAMSGDATLSNSGVLTLDTVNSNVGSFGSSTSIPSFTVNAKGLITAASGNAVIAPAGTLTGTTLASNVVSSSLTSVGTITTGVWNGTVTAGFSFLTSGTTYTTPAGITTATLFKFTVVGGGGGGAGGGTTAADPGVGGGAGATGILYATGLSPSTAYTIAIGAAGLGGAGDVGSPSGGTNGGNTTLILGATTYTAGGGTGGSVTITSTGGVGGTASGCTINMVGGSGQGVAGASQDIAGYGGSSFMGQGGAGQAKGTVSTATGYGAGGSGGWKAGGANGTPGCIVVEWHN